MNETNLVKKRYLEVYSDLIEEVEREVEKAGYWKEKAYSVSGVDLTNMGIRSSNPSYPIDKFLELSEKCAKMAIEAEKKRLKIMEEINKVEDQCCRQFLLYRYVDRLSLKSIAVKMNFSLSYIRHLHLKALKKFNLPKN